VLDETESMSPSDSKSATTLTDVEDSSFPLFHSAVGSDPTGLLKLLLIPEFLSRKVGSSPGVRRKSGGRSGASSSYLHPRMFISIDVTYH
jgi:hypothetical protein